MIAFRDGLLTAMIVLAACSTGNEDSLSIGADNEHIRYTGRWNFDDAAEPWVGWQGSMVSVAFRGSGISATVDFGDDGELFGQPGRHVLNEKPVGGVVIGCREARDDSVAQRGVRGVCG